MRRDLIEHYYRSADGLELHCRVYPALEAGGLPVLCLPGLTRNGRDFVALARHLEAHRDVLAADLRGRGLSQWDAEPAHYRLPTYVEDVWRLLESRAIETCLIVGTSLGALMAMVMAAMRPQAVAGIVLNDAGPELDPAGLRRIAGYAGKLPPVSNWAQAVEQAKSLYGAGLPGLTQAEWLDYARCGYRENAAGVPVPDVDPAIGKTFGAPEAASPPDLWPLFAQIRAPTLVIHGALSDILSARTVERMAREKPGLETVTLANRGHVPLLNEPECLAAIDAFVARYG
jgi:pimeloyl-ACP methyl ester carboxylesterase